MESDHVSSTAHEVKVIANGHCHSKLSRHNPPLHLLNDHVQSQRTADVLKACGTVSAVAGVFDCFSYCHGANSYYQLLLWLRQGWLRPPFPYIRDLRLRRDDPDVETHRTSRGVRHADLGWPRRAATRVGRISLLGRLYYIGHGSRPLYPLY